MPTSIEDTVDILNARLQRKGGPMITMPWADFYKLCDIDRFKDGRAEKIRQRLRDKFGLVIAYGQSAVLVAHDRNFEP